MRSEQELSQAIQDAKYDVIRGYWTMQSWYSCKLSSELQSRVSFREFESRVRTAINVMTGTRF